jgi:hypothetical protein
MTAARYPLIYPPIFDQRVRDLEIGVDVLHVVVLVERSISFNSFSPVSSSPARVLRLPGQRRLAGSPNFASSALATSRKVSCEA